MPHSITGKDCRLSHPAEAGHQPPRALALCETYDQAPAAAGPVSQGGAVASLAVGMQRSGHLLQVRIFILAGECAAVCNPAP